MPKLSVWTIRAALIHMGVGFLFGSLILHHKGIPIFEWTWKLLNPHIEVVIFGWVMQLVMGVAFFALPRFAKRENRYGAERIGWLGFYLLNAGVVLTSFAYWSGSNTLAIAGRSLTSLGIAAFVALLWPRVKAFAADLVLQQASTKTNSIQNH